jgi:diguanylate cyclase (GGDEF)-like protein
LIAIGVGVIGIIGSDLIAWQHSTSVQLGIVSAVASALGVLPIVVIAMRRSRSGLEVAVTDERNLEPPKDDLTGLSTRAVVLERAERLLIRMRSHDRLVAALFIDLDGFESVNGTFGHHVGDELLRAAAKRLSSVFRLADTVGRMGGDQFVILLDGPHSSSWPERAAQRVLDVMRQPFPLEVNSTSRPLFITASVGLATGDRRTGSELLRDADLALCRAKAGGTDCYQVFEAHMHEIVRHRLDLEVDLHSAVGRREFELHYQPIYDLNDLTVVGVEALLRWNHPTLGLIQPDDFIPTLERTGQIVDVGRWALNQACRQASQWRLAGRAVGMSVNVSARQLDSHTFAADVFNALNDSNLVPSALTIEITESALMRDTAWTAQLLGTIRSLGVHVAIDDFGTGFSSLAYIQQFPIDSIKIDRSFTQAIGTSPESDALLRTVVQLAADLGLRTVAEGIETIAQLDGLRDAHVHEAQGFLLSRPLDAPTVTTNILQTSTCPSHLRDASRHRPGQ